MTKIPGAAAALESFALSLIAGQSAQPSLSTFHKRVAAHQFDERKRAEVENTRLRNLLLAQAKLPQSLQRSFLRCPSALVRHRKRETRILSASEAHPLLLRCEQDLNPPEPKLKNRSLLADPSAEGARVYVRLAERLDSLYEQVDSVFAETGFSDKCEEFNATRVKTDPVSGRTFVDLTSSFVMPFDINVTNIAFWMFFTQSSADFFKVQAY